MDRMSKLAPRINRLPPTTPAAHGEARRGAVPQDGERREAVAPGHDDATILSAAGRAALDRTDDLESGLSAEQAQAIASHAADASVSIAGAAHTVAVMRGARLLR